MPKRIKVKIHVISYAQKNIPQLSFNINGLNMEYVTEFNFLGLILDSNLNWKAHTNSISVKIARVIGLLHRLKFVFPIQILFSIYNSLILPHMSYKLLAWGTQCNKIELLQKKAVRVLFFKSPIAHTEPIFKRMNGPLNVLSIPGWEWSGSSHYLQNALMVMRLTQPLTAKS